MRFRTSVAALAFALLTLTGTAAFGHPGSCPSGMTFLGHGSADGRAVDVCADSTGIFLFLHGASSWAECELSSFDACTPPNPAVLIPSPTGWWPADAEISESGNGECEDDESRVRVALWGSDVPQPLRGEVIDECL